MNKSVVATSSGSTKDLLFENNFKLVNTNDIEALVNGVAFYLDHNSKVDTRKHLINLFSKEVMTNKVLQAYKAILQ
jgi:glycosyltransferase involved in cell wall biosynthesis